MSDINNREGVEQANKALRALERPRRQTDPRLKEEEELTLKQMISGIIPEWRDTDNKRKKGVIALLGSWTGEMMNWARIQMKTWIIRKNAHTASVQKGWDNREKCTWHSRDGEKGYGMIMMHKRGEINRGWGGENREREDGGFLEKEPTKVRAGDARCNPAPGRAVKAAESFNRRQQSTRTHTLVRPDEDTHCGHLAYAIQPPVADIFLAHGCLEA
eukprot:6214744-Pleurochrysis_carterae.AAC.2